MIINPNFYKPADFNAVVEELSAVVSANLNDLGPLHVVFISLPMRGKDVSVIEKQHIFYANKINMLFDDNSKVYVIPTRFVDYAEQPPSTLILRALTLLCAATIVSVTEDCVLYRGCSLEYYYASSFKLSEGTCALITQPFSEDDDFEDTVHFEESTDDNGNPIKYPIFLSVEGNLPATKKYNVLTNYEDFVNIEEGEEFK